MLLIPKIHIFRKQLQKCLLYNIICISRRFCKTQGDSVNSIYIFRNDSLVLLTVQSRIPLPSIYSSCAQIQIHLPQGRKLSIPLLKRPSLKEHLRKAKCAMKNKKTSEDTDCIRLETRQTSLISSFPGFSASQEEAVFSWLVFLSSGRSFSTRHLLPSWLSCITGGSFLSPRTSKIPGFSPQEEFL